eukprot:UN19897
MPIYGSILSIAWISMTKSVHFIFIVVRF